MKTRLFFTMLGVIALVPGFNAQGQHKEMTVRVDAPTGSLLGAGYASSYLTNIRSKTMATDDSELRSAIDSLDALGMVSLRGYGLVPAAVAWQADVPIRKLIQQQAETDLSYGELLLANCIATKSRQDFDRIVALRQNSHSWGEVMRQLQVDADPIIGKAEFAAARIRDAADRNRRRRGQDLHDTMPSQNQPRS